MRLNKRRKKKKTKTSKMPSRPHYFLSLKLAMLNNPKTQWDIQEEFDEYLWTSQGLIIGKMMELGYRLVNRIPKTTATIIQTDG
jgi:hypothetical protein